MPAVRTRHVVYVDDLSTHPDAAEWGTDLLRPDGPLFARAPGTFNTGLIFIPAADTWPGFSLPLP